MLRCYLLALCRASSLDTETKNFSLFSLVEDLQVTPFAPRIIVPIEVHTHFEAGDEDLGHEFEVRGVWISEAGTETPGDAPNILPVSGRRMRMRAMHLRLPPATGFYRLGVEWRRAGTETWVREDVFWPVNIQQAASSPDPDTGQAQASGATAEP